MAVIRLDRFEAEEGDLPAVCMKCGASAVTSKMKRFAWHPPWVWILIIFGLLPFAIVALVVTKRMIVRGPLCNEHRNHWLWRAWFTYGGLTVLFFAFIAVMVLAASSDNGPGRREGNALFSVLCPA